MLCMRTDNGSGVFLHRIEFGQDNPAPHMSWFLEFETNVGWLAGKTDGRTNGLRGVRDSVGTRRGAARFSITAEFWVHLYKMYELALAEPALPVKIRKQIEQRRESLALPEDQEVGNNACLSLRISPFMLAKRASVPTHTARPSAFPPFQMACATSVVRPIAWPSFL